MATVNTGLYNGAAAYELWQGNAVRQPRRQELPSDRPRQRTNSRPHTISVPLAVLGILSAACVLLILVFAHMRLYAVTSEINEQKSALTALEQERAKLQGQYNGMIDYRLIETEATERLGMAKPNGSQTVYVNLAGADRGEVLGGESLISAVRGVLSEGFSNLSVYLSAAGT